MNKLKDSALSTEYVDSNDYVRAPYHAGIITVSGDTIIIPNPNVTELIDGMGITFTLRDRTTNPVNLKFGSASAASVSYPGGGSAIFNGRAVYTVRYSLESGYWVVQGDDGGALTNDYRRVPYWGGLTTGTGNDFIVSNDSLHSAYDGVGITFRANRDSNSPILKFGTSSAPIRNSSNTAAPIKINVIYTVRYSSGLGAFILQGEGGGTVPRGQEIFDVKGIYSWRAPTGVTQITVMVRGGGGGGGSGNAYGGSGGGQGGLSGGRYAVTPGTAYEVVVGGGGYGGEYGSSSLNGLQGGDSIFNSHFYGSGGYGGGIGSTVNASVGYGGSYVGDSASSEFGAFGNNAYNTNYSTGGGGGGRPENAGSGGKGGDASNQRGVNGKDGKVSIFW